MSLRQRLVLSGNRKRRERRRALGHAHDSVVVHVLEAARVGDAQDTVGPSDVDLQARPVELRAFELHGEQASPFDGADDHNLVPAGVRDLLPLRRDRFLGGAHPAPVTPAPRWPRTV
jgi:hypothetical protein